MIGGAWYYNDYTYTAATVVVTPAVISTPTPSSILAGSSATFSWNDVGATSHSLWVGTGGVGTYDLFGYSIAHTSPTVVTGLPTDGSTLYVRLWSMIGGAWYYNDYTYTAFSPASVMLSPTPDSTLTGSSATFTWNDVGATSHSLWVGTGGVGTYDLFGYSIAHTSPTTVTGLPTDGSTLYVRLWSMIGGAWYYRDYTYTTGP